MRMIHNFASHCAQDIFDGVNSANARKLPKALFPKARRLLDQLNAADQIEVLQTPPGNRLEKLKGFWSIRINKQWLIICNSPATLGFAKNVRF